MRVINRIKGIFLDTLFPQICLNCKVYLENNSDKENLLCEDCFDDIEIYKSPFRVSGPITLASVGSYENDSLRELIHGLKYKRFLATKAPIKKLIERYLGNTSVLGDVIVPIPLHHRRLRERGFNQAKIIADILAEELNLPIQNILGRTRNTEQQVSIKDDHKRLENIRDAFSVGHVDDLENRSVILVDDVYTSGATALEAAKALGREGVNTTTVFVLARAN